MTNNSIAKTALFLVSSIAIYAVFSQKDTSNKGMLELKPIYLALVIIEGL